MEAMAKDTGGLTISGCDLEFYDRPNGKVGLLAKRPFSRGDAVYFDRALCYVDPDLANTPEDIEAIRLRLARLVPRNKQRLDQLIGSDILQLPPDKLFNAMKTMPFRLQYPLPKNLHQAAIAKVVANEDRPDPYCPPVLSWAKQLFPHSCIPNAVVVPNSLPMFGLEN